MSNKERLIDRRIIDFVSSYLEANIDELLEIWNEIADEDCVSIEEAEESIVNLILSLRLGAEFIDDEFDKTEDDELFYPPIKIHHMKIH